MANNGVHKNRAPGNFTGKYLQCEIATDYEYKPCTGPQLTIKLCAHGGHPGNLVSRI